VFEKEDLWDLLEPKDDGSGDEEPNVDNALPRRSHTVMTPAERALLRRPKLWAINMLKLTISSKVLPFIRDIRELAAIWRFLNVKYNTHTIADAMALRNKWAVLRMTDSMDVSSFMQAVQDNFNDLRNAGVIIDNNMAVHKIFTELPPRFEIFVRTLQNESRMPTLDTLAARMHLEETNLKLHLGNTTKEALVMRFKNIVRGSHGRGITWTDRNQVQPRRDDHSRGNFVNTSRSEIFCFRCNKLGHIARYCLAPASEVQQPSRPTLGTHLEETMFDTSDESFQLALEALSLKDDAEWVIDSGASHHFSGNAQAFHFIDSSALAGSAVLAGGQSHPI
jgi:hypothetical protein